LVDVVVVLLVADADGLAEAPSAVGLRSLECPPLWTATMIPTTSPSATGMAMGTAMRMRRLLLPRRRHEDLCPEGI
jgi:hypothetical protein